jgi:hypothetical protein
VALGYFELAWQYRYEGASPQRIITAFKDGKRVGQTKGGFSQATGPFKPFWSTEQWKVKAHPQIVVGTETKFGGGTGAGMVLDTTTDLPADCHVELRLTIPKGSKLSLRNVKMKPGGMRPIFNGKDLAGWKKYEGDKARAKSDFTVTKDGWLHMKNGPGDLQTEGQYDDFVLQLECKTNGKGLNSGVFFRCIPGQYQNGYEAQVHNLYKDNDRSKPTDFGTGAIYRRVPARKVVADDNEWFTMTVVAQGKHIATWVNGYQTVDWTDNRPAHDNPRQGSRTAKGHISFQGHDPTTDVHFRNIRIAVLPKK